NKPKKITPINHRGTAPSPTKGTPGSFIAVSPSPCGCEAVSFRSGVSECSSCALILGGPVLPAKHNPASVKVDKRLALPLPRSAQFHGRAWERLLLRASTRSVPADP